MADPQGAALYAQLLKALKYAPAHVHRAAYAAGHSDPELWATLAARTDTPQDVLAQLASHDDPKLQATLAARKVPMAGTTPASSARTPTAQSLSKALKAAGYRVPRHLAETVLDSFDTRPTRILAEHLLSHPEWLSPAQALAVVRTLDKSELPVRSFNDLAALRRVIARADQAEVEQLAMQANGVHTMLVTLCLPLSSTTLVEHVVRRVAGQLAGEIADNRVEFATGQRIGLLEAILAVTRPKREVQHLEDSVIWQTLGEKRRAAIGSVHRALGRHFAANWDTRPVQLPDQVSTSDDVTWMPREQLAELAAATQDPTVLAAIVERMVADGTDVSRSGLVNLLHNRSVDVPARVTIATIVESLVAGGHHVGSLPKVNVFTLPVQEPTVTATWVRLFPDSVVSQHGWGPYGGPDHAAATIRSVWEAERGDRIRARGLLHDLLLAVAAGPGVPPAQVPDLPWPVVSALLVPTGWHDESMAATVAWYLDDHLGDSTAAWRVFDEIGGQFTGPLAELVATCLAATT